jgi:hypothetical protein
MYHGFLQSREMYKYFNLNKDTSDPNVAYALNNINKAIIFYSKLYKDVASDVIFDTQKSLFRDFVLNE